MPVETDKPKTVTIPQTMLDQLTARLAALEAKKADEEPVVVIGAPQYAKKPWEEEIWVESLIDRTYPDHPDLLKGQPDPSNYGVYRHCATDERPADVFRIKHREHLDRHLRELSKEEIDDVRKRFAAAKANIPQQAARGQKSIRNPFF